MVEIILIDFIRLKNTIFLLKPLNNYKEFKYKRFMLLLKINRPA